MPTSKLSPEDHARLAFALAIMNAPEGATMQAAVVTEKATGIRSVGFRIGDKALVMTAQQAMAVYDLLTDYVSEVRKDPEEARHYLSVASTIRRVALTVDPNATVTGRTMQ